MKESSLKSDVNNRAVKNYVIPNLDRGLHMLEFLASRAGRVGVTEAATALQIPKNSAFRILHTLHRRGYVDRDPSQATYSLGGKLLSLGYSVIEESTLLEKSIDSLRKLRDATRETALLGVLNDGRGFVVEQVLSLEPVKFTVAIGHRFPLHTAAPGKAILAFLPDGERETLVASLSLTRFTARTITDKKAFMAELAEVKLKGFAVDRGEEIEGLHCVAAPILDHLAQPLAAIWVTGPSFRMPVKQFRLIAEHVIRAAATITLRFGGHEPNQ